QLSFHLMHFRARRLSGPAALLLLNHSLSPSRAHCFLRFARSNLTSKKSVSGTLAWGRCLSNQEKESEPDRVAPVTWASSSNAAHRSFWLNELAFADVVAIFFLEYDRSEFFGDSF